MRRAGGEGVWPWMYSYPSSHRLMRALGSCLREFLPGIIVRVADDGTETGADRWTQQLLNLSER